MLFKCGDWRLRIVLYKETCSNDKFLIYSRHIYEMDNTMPVDDPELNNNFVGRTYQFITQQFPLYKDCQGICKDKVEQLIEMRFWKATHQFLFYKGRCTRVVTFPDNLQDYTKFRSPIFD